MGVLNFDNKAMCSENMNLSYLGVHCYVAEIDLNWKIVVKIRAMKPQF